MDAAAAIQAAEVVYIAVGTPSAEDGSADLRGVFAVAEIIGDNIRHATTIIIKSTVPVGTSHKVRDTIAAKTKNKFYIANNPEFLKEGAAVGDFLKSTTGRQLQREVVRGLFGLLSKSLK